MGVQTEHHLQSVSRIEVLTGPTGRRRWSDALKLQMVAESYHRDVTVREVAERYGIAANHLSTWRSMVKNGILFDPDGPLPFVCDDIKFATVEIDGKSAHQQEPVVITTEVKVLEFVELETGGVTLRFGGSSNIKEIAKFVRALRDKS